MTISTSKDFWTSRLGKYESNIDTDPDAQGKINALKAVLQAEIDRFADPDSHINNLEYDLRTTDWILAKVRNDESYAQNLYAALCNSDFMRLEVISILTEKYWSCSWRAAGKIIAHMRQQGDYMDWYCSGIRDTYGADAPQATSKWVQEGVVTDEIRDDLIKLGWATIEEKR